MISYSKPIRRASPNGGPAKFYSVRIYDDVAKSSTWRSTKKATLREAKEVRDAWIAGGGEEVTAADAHRRGLAFSNVVDRWLEKKSLNASDACMAVYRAYSNQWKKSFRCKAYAVSEERIEKYMRGRKKAGKSARTINNERSLLRSLFSLAARKGWVPTDPMIDVGRVREPKRAIRTLEPNEELELLKECGAAGGNTHRFVACLLYSGLRRGAVSRLEWSHVDFKRREWRIPAALMKSDEDFHGRPIAPELFTILKESRKTAGLIFGALDAKRFESAVKAAGLDGLKPHDLRRNFVTRCRRQGVPLEVAMYLSDHRDVRVVMSCYRAISKEEAKAAMTGLFKRQA